MRCVDLCKAIDREIAARPLADKQLPVYVTPAEHEVLYRELTDWPLPKTMPDGGRITAYRGVPIKINQPGIEWPETMNAA